jgi:hypothetical protein
VRGPEKICANAYGSSRESQAILKLEKVDNMEAICLADPLGTMLFTLSGLSRKKLPTENQTDADFDAGAN